jgi:hypothetical protein
MIRFRCQSQQRSPIQESVKNNSYVSFVVPTLRAVTGGFLLLLRTSLSTAAGKQRWHLLGVWNSNGPVCEQFGIDRHRILAACSGGNIGFDCYYFDFISILLAIRPGFTS